MGRTYVNCEGPARDWNAETSEFAAVPPEMTTTLGDVGVGGVLEARSIASVFYELFLIPVRYHVSWLPR